MGLQKMVAMIKAEIQEIEQRIREFIDQHPDLKEKNELLQSIIGFAETTATYILAEMYDLANYKSAKAAAADIGVTAAHYRSGTSVRRRSKMSRMGKASIRAALHLPSMTARQYNPVIKKLVQRLKAKGKTPFVIRGAVKRKLIHLAYGVLKNKTPFDPAYEG